MYKYIFVILFVFFLNSKIFCQEDNYEKTIDLLFDSTDSLLYNDLYYEYLIYYYYEKNNPNDDSVNVKVISVNNYSIFFKTGGMVNLIQGKNSIYKEKVNKKTFNEFMKFKNYINENNEIPFSYIDKISITIDVSIGVGNYKATYEFKVSSLDDFRLIRKEIYAEL